MAERAKHAFGTLENIDTALANGTIDSYDILFVKDANGKPYVGWIDKEGNKVICQEEEKVIVVEGESLPETGVEGKIYIFEDDGYFWNGTEFVNMCKPTDLTELKTEVAELETGLTTKADVKEVEALEERVNAEFKKNATQTYEITKAPEGTLVDYFDKEIRIMIPSTTDFANLNNGIAGAENMRYVECRVYAPEGAVGYKSDLDGMVMAGKVEDFARFTDEYGRIYIITFPSVAYYDTESTAWVYSGANSTTKHYTGYNYTVEWFDENDVVIASDSVKINLSNEDCHYAVEPYYVGEMIKEIETKIDEKIAEVDSAYEIIEF